METSSIKFVVFRDTGRGDVFEDEYKTREEAEYWMEHMLEHKKDYQIGGKNAMVWIEER